MNAERVYVDLGERSYDIVIGSGVLAGLGERASELGCGSRVLVVTDGHVGPLYAAGVVEGLEEAGFVARLLTLPAGETTKSLEGLSRVYDAATEHYLDRKGFVVALGGGVMGDLAGYGAASFLRGVDFVQVPTSLLAMVDSSVGGKTGINIRQGKNLVGAFYQPRCVLADLDVLGSLPGRDFRAGMAEVVKYGVIWDGAFFEWLEEHVDEALAGNLDVLGYIVRRSCEVKALVVAEDEREGGLRAVLNFGHTLGHAIENVSGYGVFLHGEAISIGMVLAARISERVLGFSVEDTERLVGLLGALGLPVRRPDLAWGDVAEAMKQDKKSRDAVPYFVLARALGTVEFGVEVDGALVEEVWDGCR